ncbi:MAG TPA: aconitate hydratase, partial [Alphaproteobacteria bacterium]|nr:aconitate hydratase [Alphaproteobacteria bacterium]
LRKKGVVNKFVEYYGPGLESLSLADRATLGNMAPEYGATCGFVPIDSETIRYLRFTGRSEARVKLVEAYAKAQGLWHDASTPDPFFSDTLELDLASVEPSIAGPKRPQDKVTLSSAAKSFDASLKDFVGEAGRKKSVKVKGANYELKDGDVVIAAITSCTNTSNPSVLVAAGLLAKNANRKGLKVKPWVKTSLAPGSQVVSDYLAAAGLAPELDKLGFNLVGYGCTTCIGNSGPLPDAIIAAIDEGDLVCAAVLSGNRNFEGRVNPQTRANYLASPPLVVAYALAGSMKLDLARDPLGEDANGAPVYLKDVWPANAEIRTTIEEVLTAEMFRKRYANVFEGPPEWRAINVKPSLTYAWGTGSTYVKHPPYFEGMAPAPAAGFKDVTKARPIALLGDSVTTDHISPAGSIKKDSPAGEYLLEHQVRPLDFNSYGARRGNHEVMMRGTFANIRIRNEMVPGVEGGVTKHVPDGKVMPIYNAAMTYKEEATPLVVVAGKEYGTGSSRDWAAKGTLLLGIKAVVVESFERIHRSNLVGMGVLPLQLPEGTTRKTLKLDGSETFDVIGLTGGIKPRMSLTLVVHRQNGQSENVPVVCRIDTQDEVEYFRHGGILQYVLRGLARHA